MSCITVYDICLYVGDNKTFLMRYKDSDGNPIDITGYQFFLECPEVRLQKTATVDPINTGEFYFEYVSADTIGLLTTLSRRIYNYDIRMVRADTTVETLMRGKLTVEDEVGNTV